jgi:DNA-binding beta-propeller fold protein YncE
MHRYSAIAITMMLLVGLSFTLFINATGRSAGSTITVGRLPSAIAIDARTNHAFVANAGDNSVTLFNLAKGHGEKTVSVGKFPTSLAVDSQTGHVFVANMLDHRISILATKDGRVLRTVRVGQFPLRLALAERSGRVFVLCATVNGNLGGSIVDVLDTKSGRLIRTTVIDRRAKLGQRTIDFGGGGVAVDNHLGYGVAASLTFPRVYILDARIGTLLRSVTVPYRPLDVAVDEQTGRAFVVGNGEVSVLDEASGRVMQTITIQANRTREAAYGEAVAVDHRRGRLFVLDIGKLNPKGVPKGNGSITTLDESTGAILKRSSVGNNPVIMVPDVLSGRVFVINDNRGLFSLSPKLGVVSVLDAGNGTVLRTMPVGRGPEGMAIDLRTGRVFVVNAVDNDVSVLNLPR